MKYVIPIVISTLIISGCEDKPNVNLNQTLSKFKDNGKLYKRGFSRSKLILEHTIYINHRYAFYSNCKLSYLENDLQPNLKYCKSFSHRKNKKAKGLDWEHVQPASRFGQTRECWKIAKKKNKSSRIYCAKHDPYYKLYETDLHNLVPSIAEINRDRSNFRFSEIRGHNRIFGKIDFSIDFKNKKVEPRNSIKGDIARISLYMNDEYNLNFSEIELSMYNKWSNLDPISSWERKKNEMVYKIQGNRNNFIK